MATDASLIRGDSRDLTINITDEAGVPVDVSTAPDITYSIFDVSNPVALVTKTIGDGVVVVTSTITVTLDAADTELLGPAAYVHEMQIIMADGKVYTPLQGVFTLVRDFIHD